MSSLSLSPSGRCFSCVGKRLDAMDPTRLEAICGIVSNKLLDSGVPPALVNHGVYLPLALTVLDAFHARCRKR